MLVSVSQSRTVRCKMQNAFHIETLDCGDLPETAECRHEVVKTEGGLTLSSGVISTKGQAEWYTTSSEGLSVGMVQGLMSFELDGKWRSRVSGPFGYCLSAAEPLVTRHAVAEETRLRGVYLHAPAAALDRLQARCGDFDILAPIRSMSRADPCFLSWTPHRALNVLAHQISDSPYRGSLRTLYLEGKALEFLAAMLEALGADTEFHRGASSLSTSDTERLIAARDILMNDLYSPPSLDELARQIGMSTSRLTAGFRRLFAMSVVTFIQEQRLAHALAELREGRSSIAQVAFKVGYSPAYFSTLFRRKFGYQPSALTGKQR